MRQFLILTLLCGVFAGLQAQVPEPRPWSVPVYSIHEPHFGIVGGTQASSFYNSAVGDPGFQFGFHAGLTFCMPLGRIISFEPQFLYSRKGGELDYANTVYAYRSVNYRLHYLEVPLQWNIHTRSIVDLIVGGYAGYLIDATFNVETAYAYGYGELNYDNFEKCDYGLIGGIGFNLPFSKISIKYSHGFSDVVDNPTTLPYLEGARNNSIMLSFSGFLR
jgi:hypothetical protein